MPLIFNVTVNCFENRSSHVEKLQKGQETHPGTCTIDGGGGWGTVSTMAGTQVAMLIA